MSLEYNVEYDRGDGTISTCCVYWMDHQTAEKMLALWRKNYGWNGHKVYPNGRGTHPCHSPKIVSRVSV